jgi:hypothetical protein
VIACWANRSGAKYHIKYHIKSAKYHICHMAPSYGTGKLIYWPNKRDAPAPLHPASGSRRLSLNNEAPFDTFSTYLSCDETNSTVISFTSSQILNSILSKGHAQQSFVRRGHSWSSLGRWRLPDPSIQPPRTLTPRSHR